MMRKIIPMSHQVCPVAIMIICKDIQLSSGICCEWVFNDAAKRIIKWALVVCTKYFPKIDRYGQHKIQRSSVHMSKKQTIPQIWKYWITSTMSWDSWYCKSNCNVENPRKNSGAGPQKFRGLAFRCFEKLSHFLIIGTELFDLQDSWNLTRILVSYNLIFRVALI